MVRGKLPIGDTQQPTAKASGTTILRDFLERPQKDFLREVIGQSLVLGKPSQKPPDHALVSLDETPEGRAITCQRQRSQLVISRTQRSDAFSCRWFLHS